MMLLSVSEYVVRRELKVEGEKIIDPGKVKMTQPTLRAILEIFNVGIAVKVVTVNGEKQRFIARPLTDSHKKVLKYLSISEDVFCWNN